MRGVALAQSPPRTNYTDSVTHLQSETVPVGDSVPKVRSGLWSARVDSQKGIDYYRSLGHKVTDGGWHNLLDCALCLAETVPTFPVYVPPRPSEGLERYRKWLQSHK